MGKELEGLNYKELQHLEHQLNEGILSVKDRKVHNFVQLNNILICTHTIDTFHMFKIYDYNIYILVYIVSCISGASTTGAA